MNINASIASRPARAIRAREAALWNTLRTEARAHKAARAEHKKLRAELAAYDTPSAINDLLAMVDRADEPAAEVRAILTAAVESPAEKSLVDLLIELGDAAGPDFADFLPPREPYQSPVDFS